ncbi:phosphodiesterase [Cetobacterium sp. 8H]|uniref:phosphodiesterase n=1 Tax=Cetobacterium sp. 8H TaxID=2759681 RepID=UPI00163D3629|nr:phosphodiesterase [Cetobacterium sp. 8H]MBC2851211.1 phosphodiesterase [Cetobacterium sp. 8H]
MKIFVISDIHGSSYFLKKSLEAFKVENADYILILGDELYHGPRNPLPEEYNPKEVAEVLNSYKEKIVAVRGNCDSEVDQMLLEYPIMGDYTTLFLNKKRIFATHGHIFNKEKLPNLSKGDILIYGHTHIPLTEEKEGIFILNPGSISLPKDGNENSYGIFENDNFYVKNLDGKILKSICIKK